MSEVIHTTSTVYKKTSTGKIQQWRAWVVKTEDGYLLKVESGQTDGKLKETTGQVINEGKQKRSAREQAIFQANSKLNKKRDEAYFDTVEEAQTQIKLLPMLAHPFDKRKHNITYPAIVQRKFDGVRCLAKINNDGTVTLLSRKGKEEAKKSGELLNKLNTRIDISYTSYLKRAIETLTIILKSLGLPMKFNTAWELNERHYGSLTGLNKEETKKKMKEILSEIQSGKFTKEWMDECKSGQKNFLATRAKLAEHPVEKVGAQLRAMMPWIGKKKLVDSDKS